MFPHSLDSLLESMYVDVTLFEYIGTESMKQQLMG